MKAVGQSLSHESAVLHVTGRATYVEDLATRTAHCLEGAIFAATALRVLGRPPLLLDLEAVQDTARTEVTRLERNLPILVTIAQVTPLIGFLGTVWGMIQVFMVIEKTQATTAGQLAGGDMRSVMVALLGLTVAASGGGAAEKPQRVFGHIGLDQFGRELPALVLVRLPPGGPAAFQLGEDDVPPQILVILSGGERLDQRV